MDRNELLAVFDREQRRDVTYYGTRREVTPEVVRHIPDENEGLGGGAILYSQLDESNADRVIAEQRDYFAALDMEVEWKLYSHDRPADLPARLLAHGFVPDEPESVMVLDMDDAPAVYWQPVPPEIRRLTGPEGIADVVAMEEAVWQEDKSWLAEMLTLELNAPGDIMRLYAAYVDGQAVSAAWIRFHPGTKFASLWGGSTLAAYRRRGHYTALLAVRAQEARSRGFRFLTVDASPMSRPILQKQGFIHLTTTTPYNWQPDTSDE